jgi:hypothetical protein
MEDTRARARGWSEDEIEEHYGAPNQKRNDFAKNDVLDLNDAEINKEA